MYISHFFETKKNTRMNHFWAIGEILGNVYMKMWVYFFQPDISTSAKLFWNVNSFSQHPIWDICRHFLALNMLKGRGILKWRQLQKIIEFLIKMWHHFLEGSSKRDPIGCDQWEEGWKKNLKMEVSSFINSPPQIST